MKLPTLMELLSWVTPKQEVPKDEPEEVPVTKTAEEFENRILAVGERVYSEKEFPMWFSLYSKPLDPGPPPQQVLVRRKVINTTFLKYGQRLPDLNPSSRYCIEKGMYDTIGLQEYEEVRVSNPTYFRENAQYRKRKRKEQQWYLWKDQWDLLHKEVDTSDK